MAALAGGTGGGGRARFCGHQCTAQEITLKGDKNLVTWVDRESERLIVGHLLGSFPDHSIVAEEGEYPPGSSPFRWVIDPLDGTTNYAHGFPWLIAAHLGPDAVARPPVRPAGQNNLP